MIAAIGWKRIQYSHSNPLFIAGRRLCQVQARYSDSVESHQTANETGQPNRYSNANKENRCWWSTQPTDPTASSAQQKGVNEQTCKCCCYSSTGTTDITVQAGNATKTAVTGFDCFQDGQRCVVESNSCSVSGNGHAPTENTTPIATVTACNQCGVI